MTRPIICLETGERFESLKSVKEQFGASGNFDKALKTGIACHGHHFYYADEPKPVDSFFQHSRKKNSGRPTKREPVICVETGVRYLAIEDAAKAFRCRDGYIKNGIEYGYPVRGFHFRKG